MNNAKLSHQLRKSSEIYGNLIEGAPDSIVAVDLKGNIVYCNKATEILTGYAKEELVGKHFSRLVSMESKEIRHSLELFKALRKGKKVAPFEMQMRHKSGKPYWIEVHLSKIKAGGKVTGFQVNTIDITKRKQAEKTLIRSERVARERAQLLTDLRSLDRIDEILTMVCEAVRDSGLFERAVMTLHKPEGRIAHLGQVGLPPNLIKRARQAPAIDDELKSRITNKKFRISDSFFIPVQAGLDYTKTKRYIPQKKKNSNGGDWQPGDELFVPLWSSSKEIMGYLSVDTPMDGYRPDVKTIQALEMLVEAAAARVRELETQEALSESEEKFRILAEQSPNMIFINKKGRVIYVNAKCQEVMGYKKGEFYSPNFDFFVLIAPEYRKLVKASFARHIMGEEVDPYEYAIITKEGKKIEAILSTKLISYYGENAVLGIITDITARKRAEEEIRKFKTISDRARYGSAISNLEGNLIYMNESFAQMHGYKAEELLGKNLSVFHTKEQMKDVERFNKQLIQKGSYIAEEVWHKRKDGTVFPTLMSLTTVDDEKGKPLFMATTAIDITDRKQAEEALKESENRYRNLIESALDIIYTFSPDGIITSLNPSFETITGWEIKDWIGKSFTDLIHPEELSPVMKLIQESIAGKEHPRNEFRLLKKTGDYVPLDFNANPLLKDGKLIGFVGIARDITERKQAEEALRIERERLETVTQNAGVGLAIISKDYRTLWANEVLKQMFGDVEGKICYSTYNQRTEICPGCGVRKVFETGRDEVVHEQTGKGIDGGTVWSQIIATPIKDKVGNITAALEVVVDITARKRAEGTLRESEERYRTLFEDSPISLWEEDFSQIKKFIDSLRDKGVKDFRKYLENHPRAVVNCTNMVKVIDVNKAGLRLFKAKSKEELQRGLGNTFSEESYDAFREELVALTQGQTTFATESIAQTLKGNRKHVVVRWSIAPGYEKTLSKVLVSISDVTELKRAREQNLLLDTSKALSRTLKLDQVPRIATEKMAEALKTDRCSVALFDEKGDSALLKYLVTKKDSPSSLLLDKRTPPDDHFSQVKEILMTKGYLKIANVKTAPLPPSIKNYFIKTGIKSSLIIPIIMGKELFGAFHIVSEKSRNFATEEISLAQTISNQTAVAIQNSLLIEDLKNKHSQIIEQSKTLEKQYQEQNVLMKISRELSQTLDLDRILEIATKEAAQALRVDRCAAALAFPEEGYAEIRSIYVKGDKSVTHLLGYKLYPNNLPQAKEMFGKRKAIYISNIYHLSDKSFAKEYFIKEGIKSVIFSPMVHGKKLVGFFVLSTMEDFKTFTKEEIKLAQTIADQVAVAIENARLLELVRKSSEDLKMLSAQLINVQEDERKKIAQELHDEIGQTLFAMKMNLEMTKKNLPANLEKFEDMKNRLTDTENLLSQTIDQIRNLTTDLRPSMLDDFGLIPALNWYIDNFSKRTNIKVYLKLKNFKPRLSSEVETTFYRIIQEALTNVAKHAQATEVSILLARENSNACLAVEDNGIGFDAKKATFPKDRLGIFSIKERVGLLNGEFEIRSKANRGTKLSIKIPLVEKRV